ncbi:MAG TPA: DUF4114 domain-containing protein [Candidatus Eisenbacteria bacterium]|nr:DUF4114 domain-containing protein [Candidatus Eisenbacteria bacterium]
MTQKWPRSGRNQGFALLLAAGLLAASLASPRTAGAFPVIYDGRFFYTGGDITIDFMHNDTLFDEALELRTALGRFDLATGSKAGSGVTLTMQQLAEMGIGVGDELDFALHVQNTGHDFFLGSGDRNADGLSHAYIRPSVGNRYFVGFEDLMGGGDRDYNDTIFRFSGGMATIPVALAAPSARLAEVGEPSLLLLLLPAIGLLGLKRRAK